MTQSTIQTKDRVPVTPDKLDKLDKLDMSDDHGRLARLGLIRQARPNVIVDSNGHEVY